MNERQQNNTNVVARLSAERGRPWLEVMGFPCSHILEVSDPGFADRMPKTYAKVAAVVFDALAKAQDEQVHGPIVILVGDPGTSKTIIGTRLGVQYEATPGAWGGHRWMGDLVKHPIRYVVARELCRMLCDFENALRRKEYRRWRLAVVDEIDKTPATNTADDHLFDFFKSRQEVGLPTVGLANGTINDLYQRMPWLMDRASAAFGGLVLELKTPSGKSLRGSGKDGG
jgi:hypothetical protein